MTEHQDPMPALPRRAFIAAGLSALVAGTAVGLAILGGLSRVDERVFRFSRGTALARGEEEALRGFLSSALTDDRVHITIVGHSGTQGDEAANRTLSDERATVAAQLARSLGIPANRMTARGVGGGAPLPRMDGESDRAWQSRLARVEVSLQRQR
ncbi:MAG: OmpA family protein [Shimia sp.]